MEAMDVARLRESEKEDTELKKMFAEMSLAEVRARSEEWPLDNNTWRPHKSLDYLSPIKYAELKNTTALSTPARENHSSIEVELIVDKAVNTEKKIIFENSN